MATLTLPLPHRFRRLIERAPWAALAEAAARAGYAARGFVYVSVGVIALLAAFDMTPKAEGALGAMEAWAKWPPGLALLWAVGLGLYGFASWRALQAVLDVDRQGHGLRGLAARAGQAISGLVYAGLGVSLFGLIDAMEDLHEPDDMAGTQEAVAATLAMPLGGWMVMIAGLFVLGVGVGGVAQALFRDFCLTLKAPKAVERWALLLGRVGYLGRGVALIPAGVLLLRAGFELRSAEAGGLGEALEILHGQPYGDLILGLVGMGVAAFGAFALVEARYRKMRTEEALEKVG